MKIIITLLIILSFTIFNISCTNYKEVKKEKINVSVNEKTSMKKNNQELKKH